MSNHSELKDLRSECLHFKNKYKRTTLKSTMMTQMKEAFVGYKYKYKIYIATSICFLFWCLLYKHNKFKKLVSYIVLSLLISYLTFVFLLLLLLTSVLTDLTIDICSYCSHCWHLFSLLSLLTSVLTALTIDIRSYCSHYWHLFFLIFRKKFSYSMSDNNCSHKYVPPNIKYIWRNDWIISGHETALC
jgi:hypothetical protein